MRLILSRVIANVMFRLGRVEREQWYRGKVKRYSCSSTRSIQLKCMHIDDLDPHEYQQCPTEHEMR